MLTPGGPAAIYGFLYEVLKVAEWALEIDLRSPERNATNVTLLVEPRHGDLEIRRPQTRLVAQFKVRENRPWNLAAVIDDVLPDLYAAVGDEWSGSRYEFVTSGRFGDWAPAYEFFKTLASRPVGAEPFNALDDTNERFVLRGARHSERSLFQEIVRTLRERKPGSTEDPGTTKQKLWHLLSHFTFVMTGGAEHARTHIRHLVSAYVLDDAFLDDKVARLVDAILSYAAKGNRKFSPDELLRDAGIAGVALTKLPELRDEANQAAFEDLRRLTGYDRALSVRSARPWRQWGRIVVFTGESGQGKSWALGELARELVERERSGLVVFVRAGGNLQEDLTAAASRIVRDVLGFNTSASFDQLARKIRESIPGLSDPWLTVCLDDVRTAAEIVTLCDAPLDRWGIRVALTTLPRYAKHAQLARRGATVESVVDFSESELREFLIRNGREWAEIPADVRKPMRRPLLAHLFAEEASDWSPKREYELYEAWWRRLANEREQPDHPDDVRSVLALAHDYIRGGSYPWPPAKLEEIHMTGEQQVRLEAVGLLRAESDGSVRIWHDRLLNWAAAEAVASEIRLSGPAAVAESLKRFWQDEGSAGADRPRLGYVPMDVLWMAATRELLSVEQLASVIRDLEPDGFGRARKFYEMLASIGPAIIPALVTRWRAVDADDDLHGVSRNVRESITSALRGEDGAAEPYVLSFLRDPVPQFRMFGIRLARSRPAASYLPLLWAMLVEHDVQEKEDGYDWHREQMLEALSASIPKNPAWLANEIARLESVSPQAKTLAWLLSELTGADGRALWLSSKERLFAATPVETPGGLIECILNFRDMAELKGLERWLKAKFEFAAPSSLAALAVLAPDKALRFVKIGDASILDTFASWWLPWLLLRFRSETLEMARERLVNDNGVPGWFRRYENEIDAVTARDFIDKLSAQLTQFLDQPQQRKLAFESTSRVLALAAQAEVIDVLRADRGAKLEEQLIAAAARLRPDGSSFRDAADDVRILLRRVSDQGAARAVAATLLSGWKLPDAEIDWAAAYPTEEVREALRMFTARHAEGWDQKWIPHAVLRSVRALALIGDDDAVLDAIWIFGGNVVDDDVPGLIAGREPMSEALLDRLRRTLTSEDEAERARALGGLRVSRRPDLVSLALEHAVRAEPSSAERYHALRAARDLITQGVDITDAVEKIVTGSREEQRFIIFDLLFRSGTPAALDLAATVARRLPFNHVRDHAIVAHLVDDSARGKEMARLLQSKLFPFPYSSIVFGDAASYWVKLLPALDDPSLREKALDEALSERADINNLVLIECVATFDRASAFDLAHAALRGRRKGRETIPPYLAKYDARRAADVLLEHLPEERVGAVRWSIARVLRWSAMASVPRDIARMIADASSWIREAGYDLAGWRLDFIDDEQLRYAALNDEHRSVRMAAGDAIRRRTRLRQTRTLRERLAASSGSAAWCYAEALTSYGDPFLLSHAEDELCIWPIAQQKSRALLAQIEDWLKRRADELSKDAESEDRHRRRSK